jgi:hypothetical protein
VGIFDEIKSEAVLKGPPCAVGLILNQMTEEERKDFELACDDPSIAGTVIARVLQRRGFSVKAEGLRRHRKGDCRCE